jgi:hypothetical protein
VPTNGGQGFGLRGTPADCIGFACLREAASAKAGHAGVAFRPTITRGSAFSAVFLPENYFKEAISMPTDLNLSNLLIIIRIINRSNFNENDRSDTSCHNHIGDPTIADAILDRLIHNAHRIQLKGGSMRRKQKLDGN